MRLIEMMESRRLLAASIDLLGNTLAIRGAELIPNAITVVANSDGVNLDVSIVSTPRTGSPVTVTEQVAAANVTMIKVRGGRAADNIGLGSLSINARVNGLGGADVITTGGGNDRIAAGSGADLVNAGGGNDLVFGGRGNDTLNGEAGNDALWGGIGEDSVNGGAGEDILGGLLGTNILVGGDNADTFVIKPGKQSQAADFVDGVDTYKVRGKGSTDGSTPPATA